ncbi:hypothetical protein [Natrinema saccharevitans]|nr:hypothetical protein [Natrinema saccharevitans]
MRAATAAQAATTNSTVGVDRVRTNPASDEPTAPTPKIAVYE